jgi:hypothetical protein
MSMANEQGDDSGFGAGKRGRSPNYPAVTLETAIKWARNLYDSEKKSATSPLIVAQNCGFKGASGTLSGPARTAVSALKKYGLVTDATDGRMRISDDAVKYFLQPDEAERLKVLQSLALKPQIIRDIFTMYPDGLPSDDTLRYHLVTKVNFLEEGASTFLKAFRETCSFAKLDPSAYASLVMASAALTEDPQLRPQINATSSAQVARPSGRQEVPSPCFELSDGTTVRLEPSKPLTAETFDELLEYLHVFKKVLSKRVQVKEASSEDP